MLKRFGLGFAIGYALGARGGEKHYKQISATARRISESPAVQDLLEDGPESARDAGRRLLETMRGRFGAGRDEEDDDSEEDKEVRAEDESPDEAAHPDDDGQGRPRSRSRAKGDDDREREGDARDEPRRGRRRGGRRSLTHVASKAIERGKVA